MNVEKSWRKNLNRLLGYQQTIYNKDVTASQEIMTKMRQIAQITIEENKSKKIIRRKITNDSRKIFQFKDTLLNTAETLYTTKSGLHR